MKLRFYTAIITGILCQIITTGALWNYTAMEIGGITFLSLLACTMGYFIALAATETKEEPVRHYRPERPCPIITLNREEWEHDEAC